VKVTENSVTISGLRELFLWPGSQEGQTVSLKDANPTELQLFIDQLPASIKGKKNLLGFSYRGF